MAKRRREERLAVVDSLPLLAVVVLVGSAMVRPGDPADGAEGGPDPAPVYARGSVGVAR